MKKKKKKKKKLGLDVVYSRLESKSQQGADEHWIASKHEMVRKSMNVCT
jgi:hypothetical protein